MSLKGFTRVSPATAWRTTLQWALGVLLFLLLSASPVKSQEASKTLRVATKPFVPFVFEQNGQDAGFSIDLWRSIADELDVLYEFYPTQTVTELVDALEAGNADVAVAGMTITSEREQTVDFSHPFFETGLQILVVAQSDAAIATFFSLVFSPALLQVIGILLLFILAFAHLLWVFERHQNPEMFPKSYFPGIWDSFWWSVVTVMTVGYGDKAPKGVPGRLVAIIWMFSGIILISYFTASVTSTITVQRLTGSISDPTDLPGKRVATVRSSIAAEYVDNLPIAVLKFDQIREAYRALEEGQVEAVVYDSPVLLYYASDQGKGKVQVVGPVFEKQSYGIGLQEGSPYRERINRALLTLQENGTYTKIYEKWFGVAGN